MKEAPFQNESNTRQWRILLEVSRVETPEVQERKGSDSMHGGTTKTRNDLINNKVVPTLTEP